MAVSSASAAAAEEVGGLVAGTDAIPESARVDAIVDVCGGDTAAPASAMGWWLSNTFFTFKFTAFEQSVMNCERTFANCTLS